MNGADGFSRTLHRSTSPAAASGRWLTPKASATSGRWSRVPANTYGTPRSAGPTSSPRTITARPTTSPGWKGRSPRLCAHWKSATKGEYVVAWDAWTRHSRRLESRTVSDLGSEERLDVQDDIDLVREDDLGTVGGQAEGDAEVAAADRS